MEIEAGRGRGRGRGFLPESHGRTELRRPHALPPEVAVAALPSKNSCDVATLKVSTLSADAPVFVPRLGTVEAASQPLSKCDTPVSSQSSTPMVQTNVVQENQAFQQPSGPQLQYLSHPVILQVNNIVVNLTLKPHRYDQIAAQMTSILSWQVKEEALMKEIVSVIFEQGVGEANFRYNGARLCQHLTKHITQFYNGASFKTLLLRKCHEEYQCRDYYLQNEPDRLCGFTLFLADIYNHVVTSNAQHLTALRTGVCDLLMTLMSSPNDSSLIKCVAQVLKGSGHAMDSDGAPEMEGVMCRLKDVTMTAKLPPRIQSMCLSVIELRAANWGRNQETSDTSITPTPSQADPCMGTVYYSPDGVIQRIDDDDADSASDTDESWYNQQGEDLDEEVAKAFDEFLRGQQQQQQ